MSTSARFALILAVAAAVTAPRAKAVTVPEPAPHTSQEPALTPQQAILWKYTARCALRPDQELETPPGAEGKTMLFKGALGLAPEWREGKCDCACQEKVSSCLAALTNQTGDHVNVSLLSAAPSLVHTMGASENDLPYPFQEGAFFGNVFAGEAIYKVWSQRLFPAPVRASALGVTYGLARAVAAAFMFVVPVLIERHQSALLWILAACVTVSGAIGLLITHHPRMADLMRIPRPADGGLHRTSA